MTPFELFIEDLSRSNENDKDFQYLAETCELEIGLYGQRSDNWFTRVLRIHNMINALHMEGCLTFSSYRQGER